MKYIDVAPSDDVAAAEWIRARLQPFHSHCAGSVVPGGFEAYVRIDHPREGVLPVDVSTALVGVLARHTPTPRECWLALWDGYGTVYVDSGKGRGWQWLRARGPGVESDEPPPELPWRIPPQRHRSARRLELPQRSYVVYVGALERVPGWQEGPNLWWPEDRAWCVASEIDLPWTYVGGAAALAAELISDTTVAAKPIKLDETWPSGGRPA